MKVDPVPGTASFLQPRILLPFLLIAVIWGSTWLVIKGQLGTVPPSWSVTWRFLLATFGMFALVLVRRGRLRLDAEGQLIAAGLGVAQFALNFQFVYRAEQYLTSGLVAVLFALLLVPNSVFGRIFLGQKITRGFAFGTAIALAGIALLLLHEYRIAPSDGGVVLGIVLTLAALLSASTANVLQATAGAHRQPMFTLLAWAMLWGTLANVALAWTIAGPPRFEWTARYIASVGYLAIIGSIVTFPLYSHLLRAVGPGRAAYNGVLVPVIAMLLSTLFEGYRWSVLAGAGAALALAGLVVALRARNPSR